MLIEIPALRLFAVVVRPEEGFHHWVRVSRDRVQTEGTDGNLAMTSGSVKMCFAVIREVVGNEILRRIDEPITGAASS
jgi:hypothetical protein